MLTPDELPPDDVRGRAARGAAVLGARGVLIYAVGIVANVVLARLLTPRDFGIFAIGLVIVVAGTFLADGGFGAALIKRAEPPTRAELEAVAALQLGITGLVALAVAIVAVPAGRDVELIALMTASLPIAMTRVPSVIVLERRVEYRVIATADVVEAIVFYVAAIAAVAAGLGVWGLASAIVLRAAAGSTTVLVAGPLGLIAPHWSWHTIRPLLGFGVTLQATALISVAREQVLNVAVGALAGLGTLGVWALAWRIMQVPALLFQTVGRVGFPTMSRLLGADRDPRPVLERQIAAVAAVNAVLLVGLVGFAPALPTIIGDAWRDVPAVLLWSGIALLISAPVVVSAAAYLFAAGMPGRVAVATAVAGLVWLAVALPLLEPLGTPAVGVGWVAASWVNAVLLWRPVTRRTGARIGTRMALPTVISLAAVGAAWWVAHEPDERLLGGALGLLTGEAIVLAGLMTVSPAALRELRALGGLALRGSRRTSG